MSHQSPNSRITFRRPFTTLEAGYEKYANLKDKYNVLVDANRDVKRKRADERSLLAEEKKRRKLLERELETAAHGSQSSSLYRELTEPPIEAQIEELVPIKSVPASENIELLKVEIADLKSDQDLLKSTISQNEALIRDRDVKDEQNRELRSKFAYAAEQSDKYRNEIDGLRVDLAGVQETLTETSEKLRLQTELREAIGMENGELKAEIEQYRTSEANQKLRRREIAIFLGINRDDLE